MPGPYSPTGPFANGGAPALAQGFFNNLEAYIAWAEGDASAQVSVSGTTAGTAVLYQFLQGGLKGFFLYFNGYRNTACKISSMAIPAGISSQDLIISGLVSAREYHLLLVCS